MSRISDLTSAAAVATELRTAGFASAGTVLSDVTEAIERLDAIRRTRDPRFVRPDGSGAPRKIVDTAFADPYFLRLASLPRLSAVAENYFGCAPRLHTSTSWWKPAGGPPKRPHQDAPHWTHVDPPTFVTVWVALTAATTENGCMTYLPRSHTAALPHENRSGELVTDGVDEESGTPVPLPPGQGAWHDGMTVHWTGPNRTSQDRIALAFCYLPSDATVDPRIPAERFPLIS